MSTDLIPFSPDQLPSVELASDDELKELTKGTDFLQRVQLITKGKYVDTSKIAPGRFGVPQPGGEEILDLGEAIDILPLVVRPKALDMRDRDAIIAVYDMKLPEFERIQAAAAETNSSCMWGPSFLIIERNTGNFYEFFMGNKSARQESGKLRAFLPTNKTDDTEAHGPSPCTVKCRYIQRPAYGWHVPVVSKCSEPFANLPSLESIRAEMQKFADTKEAGIERVNADEEAASGRAR